MTILEVFVACPSDCNAHRASVNAAISEVNRILEKPLGVHLKYLGWDESVVPGKASRAQEVINSQIGNNYDILVGILGAKFGSPTGMYESGTQEEFENAIGRFERTGKPEIMIYIDKSDRDLYSVDIEQFEKVRGFVTMLQKSGVLTAAFKTSDEFERLLRTHLAERAREIASSGVRVAVPSNSTVPTEVAPQESIDDTEPLGILDAAVVAEDKMLGATNAIIRIGQYVNELTDSTTKMTNEVQQAKSAGPVGAHQAKQFVDAFADDLDLFALRTRNELPLVVSQFRAALDAVGILASLRAAEVVSSDGELAGAKQNLQLLGDQIRQSIGNVQGFRNVIQSTPGLTARYNRAKRQAVVVLDTVILEFDRLAGSCQTTAQLLA